MTEEDVSRMQDKALGDYYRAKSTSDQVWARIQETVKSMKGIGDVLELIAASGLSTREFTEPWLNAAYLRSLGQDAENAFLETDTAKAKVEQLGLKID